MHIPMTFDRNAVYVPLSNHPDEYAIFDPADWEAWQAAGMPQTLFSVSPRPTCNYVAYSCPEAPGGFAYAARWITKARYRDVVRYRTRNRFDLRRRNLRLMTVKGIV
jgi:hypothetical protein